MEVKQTLVEKLEQTISEKEKEIEKNDSYKSLKQANDFYNKMVKDGIVSKRGFTLRGIEDTHLFQVKINS